MTILCNNRGVGGFLDLPRGQTGSLDETYSSPATRAPFAAAPDHERLDALGLAFDLTGNLGSYTVGTHDGKRAALGERGDERGLRASASSRRDAAQSASLTWPSLTSHDIEQFMGAAMAGAKPQFGTARVFVCAAGE